MLISNDNKYIVQIIYKDNVSPRYLKFFATEYLADRIEFCTIFKSINDAKIAIIHFSASTGTKPVIKEFRIISCKLSTINLGETVWVIGNDIQ